MVMRPGLEETMALNEDVSREFCHVKDSQERIETHLFQQDRQLSDHFKKFAQHILDDQVMKINLEAHLIAHKEQAKHRWVIISGILLTAVSTIGMLVVEIFKHFWLKG